jgi:hypothetical protein
MMHSRFKNFTVLLLTLAGLLSFGARAETSQSFGDYSIHYNAFTTDFLNPDQARIYKIQRSTHRAVLVVTVLKKVMGTTGVPVEAVIRGTATNLTGQLRNLELRTIRDGAAPYYIADFLVNNEETLDFVLQIAPEGKDAPYTIKFRQQFFTD